LNPAFQPKKFQSNFAQPSENQAQQLFVPQYDKHMTSLEKTIKILANLTAQNLQSNTSLQDLSTSHMQSTS